MKMFRRAAALAAVLAMTTGLLATVARADSTGWDTMAMHPLANPATNASAVSWGSGILVAGDDDGPECRNAPYGGLICTTGLQRWSTTGSSVVEYRPSSACMFCPPERHFAGSGAAIAAQSSSTFSTVFLFGGEGSETDVHVYEGGSLDMVASLPGRTTGASAVYWGPRGALVFGGGLAGLDVYSFNGYSDTVSTIGALPPGTLRTGAVVGGNKVYLTGLGCPAAAVGCVPGTRIGRWNITTNQVDFLEAVLPSPADNSALAYVDGQLLIMASNAALGDSQSIYKVDLATQSVITMDARLPSAVDGGGLARIGNTFYLAGGAGRLVQRYSATPDAPEAPVATVIVDEDVATPSVALSWEAPSTSSYVGHIQRYLVRRTVDGMTTTVAATTSTSYVDTALQFGQRTTYRVVAQGILGDSEPSAATTVLLPAANRPRAFHTQSGPGAGEVTLHWKSPNGGAEPAGYRIYRGPSKNSLSLLTTVAATTDTFVDTGLGEGVTNYYEVATITADGEGEPSVVHKGTTFARPSAVQNLEASHSIDGAVVTWDPPADDGRAEVTYRVLNGGSWIETTETTFVDPGCSIGRRCQYSVVPFNIVGNGPQAWASTTGL